MKESDSQGFNKTQVHHLNSTTSHSQFANQSSDQISLPDHNTFSFNSFVGSVPRGPNGCTYTCTSVPLPTINLMENTSFENSIVSSLRTEPESPTRISHEQQYPVYLNKVTSSKALENRFDEAIAESLSSVTENENQPTVKNDETGLFDAPLHGIILSTSTPYTVASVRVNFPASPSNRCSNTSFQYPVMNTLLTGLDKDDDAIDSISSNATNGYSIYPSPPAETIFDSILQKTFNECLSIDTPESSYTTLLTSPTQSTFLKPKMISQDSVKYPSRITFNQAKTKKKSRQRNEKVTKPPCKVKSKCTGNIRVGSRPEVHIDPLTGCEKVTFTYTKSKRFTITSPRQLMKSSDFTNDYLKKNCVYPRANVPEEEYTGNRRDYECECNDIGWTLCWYNAELREQRGLIQRAVDSWRNTRDDKTKRSRRMNRIRRMDD